MAEQKGRRLAMSRIKVIFTVFAAAIISAEIYVVIIFMLDVAYN